MCHSSGPRIMLALFAMFLLLAITSCASDTEIVVSFDGDECIFEGPEEVETGDQIVKKRNTSDLLGWAYFCRVEEGYFWQDTLDFIGVPGSDSDWPTWCQGFPSSSVVDANSNEVVHEYKLRYEGEYHVIWYQNEPEGFWPCGVFDVIEAASD